MATKKTAKAPTATKRPQKKNSPDIKSTTGRNMGRCGKAARIQLMATASGDPSWTNDAEAAVKYEQIYTPHRMESMWEYFVRRAKKFRKSS